MKKLTTIAAGIVLAAGLAGGLAACGTAAPSAPEAVVTVTAVPTPTPTVTKTVTPTPTPTVTKTRIVVTPVYVAPASPALTDCGNYLYVNADTSCSFALNVEENYTGLGADYANSPVTGLNYIMNCVAGTDNEGSSGQSVECTGGNNAYVMWPAN
jgi:hypothetical protein